MDWTPERQKRIYDEYTLQEWANWIFGMEDVGWGRLTKEEWRDWAHDMGQEHGMPAKGLGSPQMAGEYGEPEAGAWGARARPAQGQPAQGQPAQGPPPPAKLQSNTSCILEYAEDSEDKTEEGKHSHSSQGNDPAKEKPVKELDDKTEEGEDSKPSQWPPAKGKRRVRFEEPESEEEHLPLLRKEKRSLHLKCNVPHLRANLGVRRQ